MGQKSLRSVSIQMAYDGFRVPEQTQIRQTFLQKMLKQFGQQNIDLVILPAGYFTVNTESETGWLLEPIFKQAGELGISLIVGVDGIESVALQTATIDQMREVISHYRMPCFLYAYEADTGECKIWRQRSCTSWHAEAGLTSSVLSQEKRVLQHRGYTIETWLCGECYDRRLVAATQKRKPDLVCITGHLSMPRFPMTMRRLRQTGLNILQSEHRYNPGGLHPGATRYKNCSTRNGTVLEHEEIWSDCIYWQIEPNKQMKSISAIELPGLPRRGFSYPEDRQTLIGKNGYHN